MIKWGSTTLGASQAPSDPSSCYCRHQPYLISFIIKKTPKNQSLFGSGCWYKSLIPLSPLKNPSKVEISRRKMVKLSRQAVFPSTNAEIREEGGFYISSRFSLGKSQTCCQLCFTRKIKVISSGKKRIVFGASGINYYFWAKSD